MSPSTPPTTTHADLLRAAGAHLRHALSQMEDAPLEAQHVQHTLTRWLGVVGALGEYVSVIAPDSALDDRDANNFRGHVRRWRDALLIAGTATRDDYPPASHPAHAHLDTARASIRACIDIASTHVIPPRAIPAVLEPAYALTMQLAAPTPLIAAALAIDTSGGTLHTLTVLRDATPPVLRLAHLTRVGYTADDPRRALPLRSSHIAEDASPFEWQQRCQALADRLDSIASTRRPVPVHIAQIVAGAQLRNQVMLGDDDRRQEWRSILYELRTRNSPRPIDHDVSHHWSRIRAIYHFRRGQLPPEVFRMRFATAAAIAQDSLDRAAFRVWEMAETGRIDQWVAGKIQRPYLPVVSRAATLPQPTTAPLPALPIPPAFINTLDCEF